MQKSSWIANSSIFGCLAPLLAIIVLMFERLSVFFRFSSEFNLIISLLTGIGIAFGALGVWNNKERKHVAVRAVSLIGIIVNAALLYSVWSAQPPEMTGTISRVFSNPFFGYERSLEMYVDLPASDLVESNLNPEEPVYIINVTHNTIIYENVKEGLERIIDSSQLQENQHIKVEWDGSIIITDPGQIRALRITVLDE
jgi:hypothetical protein